jgi:hypothetical protein
MFEREFGAVEPLDEDGLRVELGALEAERVDLVEARIDFWRWGGWPFLGMLWRIGKRRQASAPIAIVPAYLLMMALAQTLPDEGGRQTMAVAVTLGWLVLAVVVEIYQYTHFQRWVADHNARVDERIRDLLERTRADGG